MKHTEEKNIRNLLHTVVWHRRNRDMQGVSVDDAVKRTLQIFNERGINYPRDIEAGINAMTEVLKQLSEEYKNSNLPI